MTCWSGSDNDAPVITVGAGDSAAEALRGDQRGAPASGTLDGGGCGSVGRGDRDGGAVVASDTTLGLGSDNAALLDDAHGDGRLDRCR